MNRTVQMSGTRIPVDKSIARHESPDDLRERLATLRASGLEQAAAAIKAELSRRGEDD